jgi:hypothetical protein
MSHGPLWHRPLDDAGIAPDSDRLLADWFAEEAPVHEPPVLLPATLARIAMTRRKPGWRVRDRWLWPPVGRPGGFWRNHRMTTILTALVLASGASLLFLASVDRDGTPDDLGATSGRTLVVDHDGAGDFESIIDAVRGATDGDTIALRPGRYPEWVFITGKDLAIVGQGERADVIVESGYDNTFTVTGSALTLSNLTVIGAEEGVAIKVSGEGGSATLDGVDLRLRGSWCCGRANVSWDAGATGVLRDSTVEGKLDVLSGSSVTIEDSILASTCVEVGDGAHAAVNGNDITGCPLGYGIAIRGGSAVIEGNDISVPASTVTAGFGTTEERVGLRVGPGSGSVTVRDNVIHGSRTGLAVAGSDLSIEGNEIVGNDVGIESSTGLTLGTGNRLCENGQNLDVTGAVVLGDAEVCEDAMPTAEG